MARKVGLRPVFEPGVAREATALLAADSATLSDANFPVAAAISCQGFDTIFVGAEIVAGAGPTMTVEALFRDAEAADGSRWKRLLLGAKDGITALASPASEDTGALGSNSDFAELRVFGAALVYLRIKAVASAAGTTAWKILVCGGKTRNTANIHRASP